MTQVKVGDRVMVMPDVTGKWELGTVTECEGDMYDGNVEVTLDSGEVTNFPIPNWNQDRACEQGLPPKWPEYNWFTLSFIKIE